MTLEGDILTKIPFRTLHKIYIYIEAQQDGNKIKHLLRNNEMQHLFKDCHTGLDRAMAIFKVHPIFYCLEKTLTIPRLHLQCSMTSPI
jgi:hypothetical protein